MKKKLFFFFLTFSASGILVGQSISRELLSNSGDHYSNSSGMISWSIGEPLSETYTGTSEIITQGFHQSRIEVLAIDENNNHVDVKVYPNPTHDYINLTFMGKHKGYTVHLFDFQGKVIRELKIDESVSNKLINLSTEASGTYLLKLTGSEQKSMNTYKIQKLKY